MASHVKLPVCLLLTGLVLTALRAQEGADRGRKDDEYETAKMFKLIEKSHKQPQTERERMRKEVLKLGTLDENLADDFERWFTILAQGAPVWDRERIARMDLAEIYDRVAERLENRSGKIPRAAFLAYAQRYWRDHDGLLWKQPKEFDSSAEAEKLFRKLDRDDDGQLMGAELPETLRAELKRWDRSRDGVIGPDEYHAYFTQRLNRVRDDYEREMTRKAAPPEDTDRPDVVRAGRLPPGLPSWFPILDRDGDGQISLFEWRRHGWDLDEFPALDSNDDGLLDPAEMLRLLRLEDRDGVHPFAYLLEKKADAGSTPKGGKKKRS